MPKQEIEYILLSLEKAKNEGKEYNGQIIIKIQNNKVTCIERDLEIKQRTKKVLA